MTELQQLFDSVEAKQYKRPPDMNKDLRLGFALNHFAGAKWKNVTGARKVDGHSRLLSPYQRALGGVCKGFQARLDEGPASRPAKPSAPARPHVRQQIEAELPRVAAALHKVQVRQHADGLNAVRQAQDRQGGALASPLRLHTDVQSVLLRLMTPGCTLLAVAVRRTAPAQSVRCPQRPAAQLAGPVQHR